MSTADGQTTRVNRVLEDTQRSICAEFVLNNAAHASTVFNPFYLNESPRSQVPLTWRRSADASIVSGGEARKAFSAQVWVIEPESLQRQLLARQADAISRVRTQWHQPKTSKKRTLTKQVEEI
ncbi:LOW QUALITY PROTEIN: Pol protein [Phytophthora palmivora]|uniref:Pol protein n=1 Tax=Phytophthora palmivora TaxID=4796 RepID=A0A2P4XUN4_9STRA|nr:LOW QUALITY PROTEIN: Pol protein [Phytophthora palmivora]